MSDSELRDRLQTLVRDEPPLHLDLAPVVGQGRQLRHRRRLTWTSGVVGVAAAVAAVVAVPVVVLGDEGDDGRLTVVPQLGEAPANGADGPDLEGLTPMQRRIAVAIMKASPEGWTFDLSEDRWDDNYSVEAVANDGAGPGRLLIGVSMPPGMQQLRPCEDPEFRQGVDCETTRLDDGSYLSVREVVSARDKQFVNDDSRGDVVRYTDVTLTHPDGTGVMAESTNTTLVWPLPDVLRLPDDKQDLYTIERERPTYTPDQLARVVRMVDSVVFG